MPDKQASARQTRAWGWCCWGLAGLGSCAGTGPRPTDDYIVGWALLGLLLVGMLVLFLALIRYIRGGRKPPQKPAEPQARRDYRDDDDEEDTEPPSC